MDTLSPFSLPASIVNSDKRSFVNYHATGTKVEWSSDDDDPPPNPARKKVQKAAERAVVASVDSFPTAVLAAKGSFESVYFVPVARCLRGQGRGATELSCDDPLQAVAEAEEALAESDSVVIFAGDRDLAATLARMATRGKRCGLPMPKDPELAKFCKKVGLMSSTAMRGAFDRLLKQ